MKWLTVYDSTTGVSRYLIKNTIIINITDNTTSDKIAFLSSLTTNVVNNEVGPITFIDIPNSNVIDGYVNNLSFYNSKTLLYNEGTPIDVFINNTNYPCVVGNAYCPGFEGAVEFDMLPVCRDFMRRDGSAVLTMRSRMVARVETNSDGNLYIPESYLNNSDTIVYHGISIPNIKLDLFL